MTISLYEVTSPLPALSPSGAQVYTGAIQDSVYDDFTPSVNVPYTANTVKANYAVINDGQRDIKYNITNKIIQASTLTLNLEVNWLAQYAAQIREAYIQVDRQNYQYNKYLDYGLQHTSRKMTYHRNGYNTIPSAGSYNIVVALL